MAQSPSQRRPRVTLEPSTTQGCVPGQDRGASSPSPLLILIFPQLRQQTGIQAPGLTDRGFYESCWLSAPQGASSCLWSCLQSHEARKCQLGLGEPSLPGSCCTVCWWGWRRMRRAAVGSSQAVGTCLLWKCKIAKTGREWEQRVLCAR